MTSTSTAPIPTSRLSEIANDACDSAFQSSNGYDHTSTQLWNSHIINTILQTLIKESSSPEQSSPFKFAVNSTIIQHGKAVEPDADDLDVTEAGAEGTGGKRGMHSASGAYWNSEKDGMWNFKYEKAEQKGFDVVISVIWISVV